MHAGVPAQLSDIVIPANLLVAAAVCPGFVEAMLAAFMKEFRLRELTQSTAIMADRSFIRALKVFNLCAVPCS